MKFYFTPFLTFLLTFFINTASGQQNEISWGPKNPPDKGIYLTNFLGHSNNAYYLVGKGGSGITLSIKDIVISKYDLRHNLIYKTHIPFEIDKQEASWNTAGIFNDEAVVFMNCYDKKTKNNTLYYFNISSSGDLSEPQKLYSCKGSIGVSILDKKILVLGEQTLLFNEKIELVWQKELEENSKIRVLKSFLDNDNNLFRFAIDETVKPYKYVLLNYHHQTDLQEQTLFGWGDLTKLDKVTGVYHNGAITFTALKKNQKNNGFSGISCAVVETKTGKILSETDELFNTDDLSKFIEKKDADKGHGLPLEFSIKDVLVEADGSIKVFAESFRFFSMQPNSTIRSTDYYNEDIVIINLDRNGKTTWVSKVAKRQFGTNTTWYSSYLLADDDDYTYLIYNDDSSIDYTDPKKWRDRFNTLTSNAKSITVVQIANDGTIKTTHESVKCLPEQSKIGLMPEFGCERISSDLFIVRGSPLYSDAKETRYGTLSLKPKN